MTSNGMWAAWYRVFLDIHEKRQAEKEQANETHASSSEAPERATDAADEKEAGCDGGDLNKRQKPVTADVET